MQVSQIRTLVGDTAADAVVVGVFQDSQPTGAAAEVDAALGGAVRALWSVRNSAAARTRPRRCWCPWAKPARRW